LLALFSDGMAVLAVKYKTATIIAGLSDVFGGTECPGFGIRDTVSRESLGNAESFKRWRPQGAAQLKFTASSVEPLPEYFATLG
jgi:hypothetical protein